MLIFGIFHSTTSAHPPHLTSLSHTKHTSPSPDSGSDQDPQKTFKTDVDQFENMKSSHFLVLPMSNPSLSRPLWNVWTRLPTHSKPISSSSFYQDQVKLNYAGNAFENQQKWGRIWWGSWMGIFAGFALLNGIQAHFDSG